MGKIKMLVFENKSGKLCNVSTHPSSDHLIIFFWLLGKARYSVY